MQGFCYNIFLQPSFQISNTDDSIPNGHNPTLKVATQCALYLKFRILDVLDSSLTAKLNIIDIATNQFDFIQLLTWQVHLLLNIKKVTTANTPKYIQCKTICKQILVFEKHNSLRKCVYSYLFTEH